MVSGKKKNTDGTRKKSRESKEKIRASKETRPEISDQDEPDDAASAVLHGLGDLVPGLGGLVKNIAKSPVFKERLDQINKKVKQRLSEGQFNRMEPRVSGGISKRPVSIPPGARGRGPSAKSTSGAKVRRKSPDQRLSTEAPEEFPVDVFDEGDNIVIIAELPGIKDREVDVTVRDRTLSIVVNAGDTKRSRKVEVPCPVKGAPKCSFNQGILRIQLAKEATDAD